MVHTRQIPSVMAWRVEWRGPLPRSLLSMEALGGPRRRSLPCTVLGPGPRVVRGWTQVTGDNPSVQVTGNRFPQRTERQRGSQSLTLSLLYIMKPALGMRTYRKKHKPQPHTKYGMSVAHIYGTRACKYTHTFTPDIGFLWQPCMKHTHTDQHWPAVWMRVDHSSLILFHWFSGSI